MNGEPSPAAAGPDATSKRTTSSVLSRLTHTSLRTRVSLAVAAASAIVIVAVAATAWLLTQRQLREGIDEELVDAVQMMAREGGRGPEIGRDSPRDRHDDDLPGIFGGQKPDDVLVAVVDSTGTAVYSSGGDADRAAAAWELGLLGEPSAAVRLVTVDASTLDGESASEGRVLRVAAVEVERSGDRYGVLATRNLDEVLATERILAVVLGLSTLGGIAVALGLGWLVGASTVAPILRLGSAVAHVAETTDLDVYVPASSSREINAVAGSFNSMMQSLREARDQQARLVADAGHELRTPLTSLRTNVEVLASGGVLEAEDRIALVNDVNEQIAELSALVADLTALAASDSAAVAEFGDVQLEPVVADAVRRAERRNHSVTFETVLLPAWVHGNAHLLERAVLNLCDNAAKWSPTAGVIRMVMETATLPVPGASSAGQRQPAVAISVTDQGPGIPSEYATKVFERFWRAPEARSDPGSGLGLSIVHQVVASHGGTTVVDPVSTPGAKVVITLPLLTAAEPHSGPEQGSATSDGHS